MSDLSQEQARAYGVHDLPAFHVFDGQSLIERLHGLTSIASIEGVLERYNFLKETNADTGTLALFSLECCSDIILTALQRFWLCVNPRKVFWLLSLWSAVKF